MALFISYHDDAAKQQLGNLIQSAYLMIPKHWEQRLRPIIAICTTRPLQQIVEISTEVKGWEVFSRSFRARLPGNFHDIVHDELVTLGLNSDDEYIIYITNNLGDGKIAPDEKIRIAFLGEIAIALIRDPCFWTCVPRRFKESGENILRLHDSIMHYFPQLCLGIDRPDPKTLGSLAFVKVLDDALLKGGPES